MTTIFLSYRRNDAPDATDRIQAELLKQVSAIHVFKDVDDIPYGSDFMAVINKAIKESDVLLAIIGPTWLESKNKNGMRRILDTADYLRIELETAFSNGVRVIPVLVGNATMPSAEDLPDSLKQLAMCSAASVRPGLDFQTDLQRLAAAIGGKRRPFAWIIAAALLTICAAVGYFGFGGKSPNPSSTVALTDRNIEEEFMPLLDLGSDKVGFIEAFKDADLKSLRPKVEQQLEAVQKVRDSLKMRAKRFAFDEPHTFQQLQANLQKKQVLYNQILKEIDESTFDKNREKNQERLLGLRDELDGLVIKYRDYLKKNGINRASGSK